MAKHLTPEQLADVLDGTAGAADRGHAASCPECRGLVAAAEEGRRRAHEADVPEPSPLYWQSFRTQVSQRLEARRGRTWAWPMGALATAAAVLVAAVTFLSVPSGTDPSPSTLPAWSALPPALEDDAALGAIEALAVETGDLADCVLAECVAELSEEETRAAARLLERELGETEL